MLSISGKGASHCSTIALYGASRAAHRRAPLADLGHSVTIAGADMGAGLRPAAFLMVPLPLRRVRAALPARVTSVNVV